MNILYAIQGTGNGHLSRARAIIPLLKKYGKLDLLVSGSQADVSLPYPVCFGLHGMSFTFGKHGGVNLLDTVKQAKPLRLLRDIRQLPLKNYNLIINDFEPVSAWAARLQSVPIVGLSHQSAVLHPEAPKPTQNDLLGKWVLQNYAPTPTAYGFHFKAYSERIYTPVIRQGIRQLTPRKDGHYTVYLPALGDRQLLGILKQLDVSWHVFSKHSKTSYREGNVRVSPVTNDTFLSSLESCTGLLCGAGFEAPAEALFLEKKVAVVPMQYQYEQHCNAASLRELGVPVLPRWDSKALPILNQWLDTPKNIQVDYPDQTEAILEEIISRHARLQR